MKSRGLTLLLVAAALWSTVSSAQGPDNTVSGAPTVPEREWRREKVYVQRKTGSFSGIKDATLIIYVPQSAPTPLPPGPVVPSSLGFELDRRPLLRLPVTDSTLEQGCHSRVSSAELPNQSGIDHTAIFYDYSDATLNCVATVPFMWRVRLIRTTSDGSNTNGPAFSQIELATNPAPTPRTLTEGASHE